MTQSQKKAFSKNQNKKYPPLLQTMTMAAPKPPPTTTTIKMDHEKRKWKTCCRCVKSLFNEN